MYGVSFFWQLHSVRTVVCPARYVDARSAALHRGIASQRVLWRSPTITERINGDKPMNPKFSSVVLAVCCFGVSGAASAAAPAVKIGVLTDMSGTYASMGGPGSVAAAQL